jgi:ribonuclease T2
MKASLAFLLSLAILASTGCSGPSANQPAVTSVPAPQPETTSSAVPAVTSSANALPAATATGKPYDFYLLNLSWSPEYCATNPGAVECKQHFGFIVHGLWPQNNDGTYPKNCGTRPGPSDSDWEGLFPTASFAMHEWTTHGVCTPYDAAAYFSLIRRSIAEVKIPADFGGTSQPTSAPAATIITDFVTNNPSFPKGSVVLSCGNNRLTAMQFCLDKNLNPQVCKAVRSCKARVVKITPR